jgi:hypothetical protein
LWSESASAVAWLFGSFPGSTFSLNDTLWD